MGILYIDESGNGNMIDSDQPYFYFGGIYVGGSNWKKIEQEALSLQQNYKDEIGDRMDTVKLSNLTNRQLKEIEFFRNFNFHGKDIVRGTGLWGKLKSDQKNYALIDEVLALLVDNSVNIIIGKMDKQKVIDNHGIEFCRTKSIEFTLLLPKYITEFEEIIGEEWITIRADGNEGEKEIVSQQLEQASLCCQEILIQNSKESIFLQLADICLWICQAYAKLPILENDENYEEKDKAVKRFYSVLEEYENFHVIEY